MGDHDSGGFEPLVPKKEVLDESAMPEYDFKPVLPKKENLDDFVKSSSEILSELFGVFNAKPPSIVDDASEDSAKKRKKSKKSKHKKKKKKKSKHRDGSSASDSDSEMPKKKSKKSKKKKRKRKKSDSARSSCKPSECESDENGDAPPAKRRVVLSPKKECAPIEMNNIPIPQMPDVSQIELPSEKDTEPKPTTNGIDRTKTMSNKIQIKNLKFSRVFEATVKQAEEEARKKAERYEDGELTDTSSSSASTKPPSMNDSEIECSETLKFKWKLDDITYDSNADKKTDIKQPTSDKWTAEKQKSPEKRKSSEKVLKKSRSRSKSKSHKSRRKSRSKTPEKNKSRHRTRSTSRHKRNRSRSHSRSRYRHHHDKTYEKRSHRHDSHRSKDKESRLEIDKKRLLEIARKNAITMLQTGTLPSSVNLGVQAQKNVITAIKCGGKSVDELTDFCKNLSRQEAIGELSSVSSGSDGDADGTESATKPFNNPFQLKDRAPIVLNIKGGTALPTQSFQEKTIEQTKVLRQQFPVSSGTQHRGAENEWRPVSPPTTSSNTTKPSQNTEGNTAKAVGGDKVSNVPQTHVINSTNENNAASSVSTMPGMIQPANIPAVLPGPQVFPDEVSTPAMDISSIVSQRLSAIRKLQQNPNDSAALNQMYQANQEMSKWAQSKQEPGQFTGSTGAQILTPKELASGYQAWARRDQLQTAAPVSSGMGMHLLQKMGWKPGEGLGKQKNGALTPLLLEVKLDTRGLVAKEETRQRNTRRNYAPTVKTLAGKHPVSLLGEFCSKRKLGVPSYTLCFECGPDHKKNFLFKVAVNGIEYQPSVASASKKQAKADAATVCLQKFGLIP